jgi:hypothetical protein
MALGGIAGTIRTLKYRWWAFFYGRCLLGFPWFWPARPPGVPAMVAARRSIRRHFGRDLRPAYRILAKVFAALTWPPAVVVHLLQIRCLLGPDAVPIRRVPGALWAAMRNNVLPGEYYAYGLWRPERKVNIDNYLYSKEGPRLFKLLNRPLEPNPVDDKLAFNGMCKAHAIPTPQILAVFAPAGKLLEFEGGRLPERDLFVKPRIGQGAQGAEQFRWRGVVFEDSRGSWLSPEDLDGYLASRARTENRTLLVQPALSNHPALRAGPNANLAPARVVTGLSADGNVSPICGYIYFWQNDQMPARYGSVALIDMASGRLSGRQPLWPKKIEPSANSDFASMLPDWEAALWHAKIAHQACSNFVFIGWDIAFTPEGPMLLEGNGNWCVDEYQRLRGEPLGHTKFADVLAVRLRDLG